MSDQAEAARRNDLYVTDFFEWTQEQARLLRERRFEDLDLENLIDEVESVGGSDKREIESRLVVLIAHLLKWKYRPGARSPCWSGTIREQRRRIGYVLRDSPSLRSHPSLVFSDQYLGARLAAAAETGIDYTLFPEQCPFTADEVLDDDFWPKQPDLYDQS
jgi:hypothetical protein